MSKKPAFVGRKKARRYALQALYSWMVSKNELIDIETYMLLEHEQDDFDREYFKVLLYGIPPQADALAVEISPYLINRKPEELDAIELTILRIGAFELKNQLDIPYKVVINEALDLAKAFGAVDSHKFVNSVLDKMAKKLRSTEQ